jgi:histidinol-phosphate aminotransferase
MLPEPKPFIPAIQAYPPGKPIEEVQREYGLKSVIKLASNENPLGPSPKAMRAMRAAVAEMNLYPDGNGFYLRQAIAQKHGVKIENVCLTNGSDEVSDLIVTAYVGESDNVVVSQHDFISYKLAAQMVGAECREVPLRDWHADLSALLAHVDAGTRLICIANPCNPIGTMVGRRDLEHFLEKVPETVLVLLDEAYTDFVASRDYPDGMRYLKRYENLIVARTFSKAYGLAGLRIGYAVAQPEVIRNFDRVRAPFNVNRMAQAAALAALEDAVHLRRTRENNDKGRRVLETAFTKLGLAFVPSQTNFILVDTGRSGKEVTEALLRQGVIVRPMGGYGLPHHIRVSIGTPAENKRFVKAMREIPKG